MKTSAVLASLLFGSIAVAAPLDPRRLVFKTEVVTEVVVIYTTVYDDEPVGQATTTPAGYFYEQPQQPSSVAVVVSSQAPAYTPPVEQPKPSSTYVAPAPQVPTPSPSPAPVETPKPVEAPKPVETPQPVEAPQPEETSQAVETPQPATSAAYVAPAPVVPSPSPAPVTPAASTGNDYSTGEKFSNVDITIYDNTGAAGACGEPLHDSDMIVALAQPAWGASTYDVMTGAATNPWCGQKIRIFYGDNHVDAKIMDLCPGCLDHDIDLSLSAWKQLTGLDEKTRLKASWAKIS